MNIDMRMKCPRCCVLGHQLHPDVMICMGCKILAVRSYSYWYTFKLGEPA